MMPARLFEVCGFFLVGDVNTPFIWKSVAKITTAVSALLASPPTTLQDQLFCTHVIENSTLKVSKQGRLTDKFIVKNLFLEELT